VLVGVFEVPDDIALRRARERLRRRRRRRQLGGAAGLILIVSVAAIVVTVTGGSGSLARARRRDQPPAASSIPLARHPAGPGVRARRMLNRLIRLGLPVYCGGPHGHDLSFTFDDGPGVYTHYALRKLAAAHEQATFFDVGKSIQNWPSWLPREARAGAIGDHTFTHRDLLMMPGSEVYDEIAATKRLIERGSGRRVVLFRPPYGAHDAAVDAIVRRLGLVEVLWSVDSADSLGADWRQIIANVRRGLRPGAIIEMHENRGQTIRALGTLLPMLARRHLRSVNLVRLMTSDPPSAGQLRRGEAGCGEPRSLPRRTE
jgi:peptidoglycan/xylan/chitin deacetylase (PgdA/CDA1 family)